MSPLTPQQFAQRIRSLPPALGSYARTCLLIYDRRPPPVEDVQDAVQESLRVAFESLHAYDDVQGNPGLKRWLFTIVRRVCWKMAQQNRLVREGHIRLVEYQRSRPQPDPAEQATNRLAVVRALTTAPLTPRERQCLRGALQGETDQEMADRLNVKAVTIASARSRALAKVRRLLKGE